MIDSVLLVRPYAAEKKQYPLGLIYVGTALKQKGYGAKIVDLQVDPDQEESIIETLRQNPNMMLGISALAPHYHWVKVFTKRVKTIFPDRPIVIGGHIAICRELLIKNTSVDYVCVGEGEEMLPELIQALNQNTPLQDVAGLAFRNADGTMTKTAHRPQIKEITIPDFDLIDMDQYILHPDEDAFFKRSAAYRKQAKPDDKLGVIMFSRGCIGHCGFCYRHHPGFRQMTVETSWEQVMLMYRKYGIRYFRIDDELFTNDPEWVRAMCAKFKEAKEGFLFRITGLRVDTVDDERLDMLKDAGCIAINYGIESCSDTTLKTMMKQVTVEQNVQTIRKTLAHGMATMAYIIWGYQGENKKTLLETIDTLLALNLPVDLVSIFYLVALPGTTVYAHALRSGKIKDEDAYLDSLDILMEKIGSFEKRYLINYSDLSLKELQKYKEMLTLLLKLQARFGKGSPIVKITKTAIVHMPAGMFLSLFHGLTKLRSLLMGKTKPTKQTASGPKNTGKPLTVLCLSFRTPPAVRPQAILLGKMVPEWIRQGIKPIIVSYDNNGKWDIGAPVHTIPPFRLGRITSHLPVLRELLEYLHYRKICRSLLPLTKEYGPDVIFSFANPQISNVVGAMLQRMTGIPNVSHFSDPWYDNPLEKKTFFQRIRVRWLERYVVEHSDRIILVNQTLRDLVMKKYPKAWGEKTAIIPHCYDPADYPQEPKKQNDVFTLRYIGAFYKKRNPEPLFRAIADLQKRPEVRNRGFLLELVGADLDYSGYSTESLAADLKKFGLENTVKVTPSVSYPKSLEMMRSADCLIVIDADIPGSPFLPCKPIDYAGSGTPIVGITPLDSPTSIFLRNLGYKAFDYSHLDGFTEHLAGMIGGRNLPRPNDRFLEQYQVKQTTAKFISVLRQTAEHPKTK
ncbi:cobalamin B12-binding domain-containing protein [Candidatus Uhrbacteria bacterium]|nr:cobalamin B12-binding domain-containing protein [Candidatus Uhrbacteria bacterium]